MHQKIIKRKIRQMKQVSDVDITSLMDIMTILLVFLLKSYNPSDLFVDVNKDLNLPMSASIELGQFSVIVKVDKNKNMWVDQTEVKDKSTLLALLKTKKVTLDQYKEEFKKNKEVTTLNLVLDESLEYAELKEMMNIATEAGFNQFKFIVKSKV